jgi:ABC-2 type transport system permease protein
MKDIWIVCKKGLKELIGGRGGRRAFLIQIIILAGVFGFFPLSQKDLWMESTMPAVFFAMIPLFSASGVIADSFAGERERKTLETLLATRLPDRAIFLGKVISALIYAWAFTVLSMTTSLIGINLVKETDGIYLYPSSVFLYGLLGSILTGLLIAGVGVFISLRASSVREAQQMLVVPMWLLFMAIGFGLPALTRALPENTRQNLLRWLTMVDPRVFGIGLLLILIIADTLLLVLGIRRFQRTRLILD